MIRKNDWSSDSESIKDEINRLRTKVEEMIDRNWDKRNDLDREGQSKCIASFYTRVPSWTGNEVFSKTAATAIVKELKESGYFVWYSTTSADTEDYWITARPECPHPWFHRI